MHSTGLTSRTHNELLNMEPFDFVVSRGAIQDIYEPDAALTAMDRILKPGGYQLHKIDLSDQGMFRDNGMNPLTFLTISRVSIQTHGHRLRQTKSEIARLLPESLFKAWVRRQNPGYGYHRGWRTG